MNFISSTPKESFLKENLTTEQCTKSIASIDANRAFVLMAIVSMLSGCNVYKISRQSNDVSTNSYNPSNPAVAPQEKSNQSKLSYTNRMRKIGEIENGLQNFQEELLRKMQEDPQEWHSKLRLVFKMANANVDNKYKDYSRFLEIFDDHNGIPPGASIEASEMLDNNMLPPSVRIDDYRYNINENIPEAYTAYYTPLIRNIHLSPNFDSANKLDNITLLHELMHGVYDLAMLKLMKSPKDKEKYLAMMNAGVIIESEAMAYALESEILNLLLNDKIRLSTESGQQFTNKEIVKLMKELNCKLNTANLNKMISLVTVAQKYFETRDQNSKSFKKYIASIYRGKGQKVFYLDESGFPIEFTD